MKLTKFAKLDEDAQEARIEKAVKRIFAVSGVTRDHESNILLEIDEPEIERDSLFFKFMSEGGMTDARNGIMLKAYLISKGIKFESTDDRNVIMKLSDFLAVF